MWLDLPLPSKIEAEHESAPVVTALGKRTRSCYGHWKPKSLGGLCMAVLPSNIYRSLKSLGVNTSIASPIWTPSYSCDQVQGMTTRATGTQTNMLPAPKSSGSASGSCRLGNVYEGTTGFSQELPLYGCFGTTLLLRLCFLPRNSWCFGRSTLLLCMVTSNIELGAGTSG